MSQRRLRIAHAALSAAVVLAVLQSCSSDDSDGDADAAASTEPSTSAAASPTQSAAPSASPSDDIQELAAMGLNADELSNALGTSGGQQVGVTKLDQLPVIRWCGRPKNAEIRISQAIIGQVNGRYTNATYEIYRVQDAAGTIAAFQRAKSCNKGDYTTFAGGKTIKVTNSGAYPVKGRVPAGTVAQRFTIADGSGFGAEIYVPRGTFVLRVQTLGQTPGGFESDTNMFVKAALAKFSS